MSHRMWFLVEWVEERNNVFPSYGVVEMSTLISNDTDYSPGKICFVRDKHGMNVRRAKILRISDDKRQLKEHKLLLEKQDHQVKNVLSMCLHTIKEMQSDSIYLGANTSQHVISGPSGLHVPNITTSKINSSSDSDSESNQDQLDSKNHLFNKFFTQYTSKQNDTLHINHPPTTLVDQRRQSFLSSTPVPAFTNEVKEPAPTVDKGTQTDKDETMDKVAELEVMIKKLYSKYRYIVGQIKVDAPVDDFNEVENNNAEDNIDYVEERMGEEMEETLNLNDVDSNAEIDLEQNSKAKPLHVRRVSAQTTNIIEPNYANPEVEMVPIGKGNVQVPARLITEINWESYSTATRQLLQAVFPRRVLATHSLSGKQSPAFADRPPKKQLDPKMIEDIVNTVSVQCGVPKRIVRNCITIKCTDEAKLYRNRQHNTRPQNQDHTRQGIQETMPSPLSSHSSPDATC